MQNLLGGNVNVVCKGFQITTSKWYKKEIKQTNKRKPRTKTKKQNYRKNKQKMRKEGKNKTKKRQKLRRRFNKILR